MCQIMTQLLTTCTVVHHKISFLSAFPIGFACHNLEVKVINSEHMITGCCDHHNCMPIAKCLNHNRVTKCNGHNFKDWFLVFSFSTTVTLNSCWVSGCWVVSTCSPHSYFLHNKSGWWVGLRESGSKSLNHLSCLREAYNLNLLTFRLELLTIIPNWLHVFLLLIFTI